MNKLHISALVLFLSAGFSSCQTTEQKVANVQKVVESEEDQKFQQFVESTPDLYKVSWRVCGDASLNLNKDINKGCAETRDIPTKGFQEPVFMWGPVGEIKFINKPSFNGVSVESTFFVKGRGCLTSGTPKEEQFYMGRQFLLEKGSNPQLPNVKVQVISKQEKEKILRDAVANAKIENASLTNFGVSSNGLIPAGKSCPTIEDWKNGY